MIVSTRGQAGSDGPALTTALSSTTTIITTTAASTASVSAVDGQSPNTTNNLSMMMVSAGCRTNEKEEVRPALQN